MYPKTQRTFCVDILLLFFFCSFFFLVFQNYIFYRMSFPMNLALLEYEKKVYSCGKNVGEKRFNRFQISQREMF